MKKKLKKLTTIFFVLAIAASFITATVVIIIIAQGGKVTPKGIEHTGIIKLHLKPSNDIKVYVDEKQVKVSNDRIENLTTGEYEIKIEKEGYSSWTKKINIEEGIVKDLFVTLFPKELKLEQITTTSIDNVFFSPDGSYLIYTVTKAESQQNGIWKLKLTPNAFGLLDNKPEKIASLNAELKDILAKNYDINIAPDNSKFLLENSEKQIVFNTDANKEFTDIQNIDHLGFLADSLTWFENGDSLIIEKDKAIYEFDIAENVVRLIHKFSNAPIYAVNGRSVVFYTSDSYYKYSNSQKAKLKTEIKTNLPKPKQIWLGQVDDKTIYITSEDDNLYFLRTDNSLHKLGEFTPIVISGNGQGAILKDAADFVTVLRIDYIQATDKVEINMKQILENYSLEKDFFKWAPESSQIIYQHISEDLPSVRLIDMYGSNSYQILANKQIMSGRYGLANNSSDFVILLSDSEDNDNIESEDQSYNLYKIQLSD